jgi:hypothetical protein
VSIKSFNWSLLDRSNLYSMLYGLKPLIVGKKLKPCDLQNLLKTKIKAHMPVRVVMRQDNKQQKGLIYIGGAYYADYDQQGKRHIEIVFSYKNKTDSVKITEGRWNRMCQLFADTVLHEIIHLRQYRSRNFKSIPGYLSTAYYAKDRREQEYYGHKDEMGAFAFNIACELYDRFGEDFAATKRYLDTNLSKRSKRTSWHRFLKAFDWDHTHPVVRTMKRKIIRNLPYAVIGKPFKTTDYLTY